jgi:hypothetical protein
MEQTRFYRDFQESFMSWFGNQPHNEQIDMLQGIIGKPVTKKMLAEYDGSAYNMAEAQDVKVWYEHCIECQNNNDHKVSSFDLEGAIKEIITEVTDVEWGFAEEFIDSYVSNILQYQAAEDFFCDLQHGGCQSGLVGGLVYYNDTRKIYINNMESIDEYIAELESEMGVSILDTSKQPRFNYAVWLTYEEFAYRIYSALFEN